LRLPVGPGPLEAVFLACRADHDDGRGVLSVGGLIAANFRCEQGPQWPGVRVNSSMAISAAQDYASSPPEMQAGFVLHAIFTGSASFLHTREVACGGCV
jgi:hypothetical protein